MKIQKIKITLEGIKPLIINSYVSKDIKNIPPDQKLQYDDNKNIVINSDRIMQFLIDNNTNLPAGCIKLFTDIKKYKMLLPKAKAYIGIEPRIIPITQKSKKITIKNITVRKDKVGGGGVPDLIERPMIDLPWEISFQINLIENQDISFKSLEAWFLKGGIEVGLGAWRPIYGQFIVKEFEEIK